MKLWVPSCMNFCLYIQDFEQVLDFFSFRNTVEVLQAISLRNLIYNLGIQVISFGDCRSLLMIFLFINDIFVFNCIFNYIFVLLIPVVEFMTAWPVDCITLDAASPRLPTTFSSRSSTPFKVWWIAPPIALIMTLPFCATDSKVETRALPALNNVSPSPLSIWRSFSSCIVL